MVCVYFGTCFQCIGLTGGIATGKSSVSQILEENNFSIIDCDKISREVSTFVGLFGCRSFGVTMSNFLM